MSQKAQYKVKLSKEAEQALHEQAIALGFHASNSACAVVLTAFSLIPASKWFEALAVMRRYGRASANKPAKGGRKS